MKSELDKRSPRNYVASIPPNGQNEMAMKRKAAIRDMMTSLAAQGWEPAQMKNANGVVLKCSYRLDVDGQTRKCALGGILSDSAVYDEYGVCDRVETLQVSNRVPTEKHFPEHVLKEMTEKYNLDATLYSEDRQWLTDMQNIHDVAKNAKSLRASFEIEYTNTPEDA